MMRLFTIIAINAFSGLLAYNKTEYTDDEIETLTSTLDTLLTTKRNLWPNERLT